MTTLHVQIDGRPTTVSKGTTIWEAARKLTISIPTLCHSPDLNPVGVCRMCVVDIGKRTLVSSCTQQCEEGMMVETNSARVEQHRLNLTALLLADHPSPCIRQQNTHDCELENLGKFYGLLNPSSPASNGSRDCPSLTSILLSNQEAASDNHDTSSPVISVDHNACILCDRCIRGCDDIQSNDVIGRTGKGYWTRIGFDLNDLMAESSCVSCGECAARCPTGALTHKPINSPEEQESQTSVDSICPYCGVGCAITFHTTKQQVMLAEGRDSPVNKKRLCVKGRYGWDYSSHPDRLTRPLIRRKECYPKQNLVTSHESHIHNRNSRSERHAAKRSFNRQSATDLFEESSWEKALDLIADRFLQIKHQQGGNALAGFGSAKGSNEEAYLFQKLIRVAFGTNNVDHCTRLCHASSVAALMETIGSGAVTNVFGDVVNAEVALVTGSNTTANHPVAATFFKAAAKAGTQLIVVDPHRPQLADYASFYAPIKPGTDVAFYNAIMQVLIDQKLIDHNFIDQRTENFNALKEIVSHYPPETASKICGISPEEIRTIAETIGHAGSMMIFWGMGISQHCHGTDNSRCLISLCLMTGNVGRKGTGLHPLRGQNNVQGASDAGLIPMVYPDYQSVSDPIVRKKFEEAWKTDLSPDPGLTVVEIMEAALKGTIQGMLIMGENPFLSDPNTNKVRKALSNLEFLVVQDIFLTETAEFADVILPASSFMEKEGTYTNTDRRVQLGRKVIESPGEARLDWEILCEIGTRMGYPMQYRCSEEIFQEFASLTSSYSQLTHKSLGPHGKLWPYRNLKTTEESFSADTSSENDGQQILFEDRFPTVSGRGRFVPCAFAPPEELPDIQFPFVLTTGRLLEHWHTGTMTRRSRALDTLQPEAFATMNEQDLMNHSLRSGDWIIVRSRRGQITLKVYGDSSVYPGSIFIPFHFSEAPANLLTLDKLDPYGKIPEFKFCAVQIEAARADSPALT